VQNQFSLASLGQFYVPLSLEPLFRTGSFVNDGQTDNWTYGHTDIRTYGPNWSP